MKYINLFPNFALIYKPTSLLHSYAKPTLYTIIAAHFIRDL